MKSFSLNHAKLVFVDSRHNFFHWLLVTLIRLFKFLIFAPLSAYFVGIGFLFSQEIIRFVTPDWFEQMFLILSRLPHFVQIQKLINQLGHWYYDAPTWWAVVVGIPLVLIGSSLFVIVLSGLFLSVLKPTYNRTHCPLCQKPIKIKRKKSPGST